MIARTIPVQLGGVSVSDIVSVLDSFGVSRCGSTGPDRVQNADLEPVGVVIPGEIVLDETAVETGGEPVGLGTVVASDASEILQGRLYPSRNPAVSIV